jgi:hypothetical protein
MNKENARAFVLGYESGEAAEQERIIQMLKKRREEYIAKCYNDGILEMDELIVLIKGETNE